MIFRNFRSKPWRYNPYSPFGPVVEPPGPGSFLSEKPIDVIRKGKVQNVPWLISVTEDEGLYPVAGRTKKFVFGCLVGTSLLIRKIIKRLSRRFSI